MEERELTPEEELMKVQFWSQGIVEMNEKLKVQLVVKDKEIERLQADLDIWHKTALEIAGMVVEAGRDPN